METGSNNGLLEVVDYDLLMPALEGHEEGIYVVLGGRPYATCVFEQLGLPHVETPRSANDAQFAH